MRRLAVLALAAAAMVGGPVQSAAREPRFVVLPVAEVERAYAHVPDLGDPYWLPTQSQAREAVAALPGHLRRTQGPIGRIIVGKFSTYALQIVGLNGPDGEPLLVVNAVCNPAAHPEWRTTYVWAPIDEICPYPFMGYWEPKMHRYRGVAIIS